MCACFGWLQCGREEVCGEQVAASEAGSAAQAKDILRFVFDDVFNESGYGDTTLFRIAYNDELSEEHLFSMQPNPASDICAIHYFYSDETNSPVISLHDITGRLVEQWNLLEGSYELLIDTRKYSNGIYTLQYSDNNDRIERQKFIIQRNK